MLQDSPNELNIKSVLVDTSFLIRLLKADDPWHKNCLDYWEYFCKKQIEIYLSTIVVSEYSVKDTPAHLPLKQMQILPFNFFDAKIAGELRAALSATKKLGEYGERNVVINDVKILAQIFNKDIDAYITSDRKFFDTIYTPTQAKFGHTVNLIDLAEPLSKHTGMLPF
jgi:predicted nucleic acid-binding protein